MASGKSINKSVRLTPEVYAFIDGYKGEGFNQKLDNLVIDMLLSENRLKKRLADLEKQIKERQKLLDSISKDYMVFSQVRREATYLEKQFSSLSERIEKQVLSLKSEK